MENENWLEILKFIQAQLREAGLESIAELSGYEEETFEKRKSFDARKRTFSMLDALNRRLSVHSSDTVDKSLDMIRGAIEGGRVEQAILFNDGDEIDVREVESEEKLVGDFRIPSARTDLNKLIQQLMEADFSGRSGGAEFE